MPDKTLTISVHLKPGKFIYLMRGDEIAKTNYAFAAAPLEKAGFRRVTYKEWRSKRRENRLKENAAAYAVKRKGT